MYGNTGSGRERERIALILGCQMVDGACVVHQPRGWKGRQVGCPYLESVLAHAGIPEPGGPSEKAPSSPPAA